MTKIALYTTNFGNFNKKLYPIPLQSIPHDAYYLTDNEDLVVSNPNPTWKYVYCNTPRHDLHPRLRAKFYKLQPWELPCLQDYDMWIYLDSCVQIVSHHFVEYLVGTLGNCPLALTPHQFRQNILQECLACLSAQKHGNRFKEESLLTSQVNYYNRNGEIKGLWWCGIFIWVNEPRIISLGKDWFTECIKFTARDQLSLPYLLNKHRIIPMQIGWKQLHENTMSTEYFNWLPEY